MYQDCRVKPVESVHIFSSALYKNRNTHTVGKDANYWLTDQIGSRPGTTHWLEKSVGVAPGTETKQMPAVLLSQIGVGPA